MIGLTEFEQIIAYLLLIITIKAHLRINDHNLLTVRDNNRCLLMDEVF
jgi:hypothetical protein